MSKRRFSAFARQVDACWVIDPASLMRIIAALQTLQGRGPLRHVTLRNKVGNPVPITELPVQ